MLKKEEEKYQDAAKAFVAATEKAYPVCSFVTVQLGKATIEASVQRYGHWWCEPVYLYALNLKTEKIRKVYAPNIISKR